MKKLLHEKLFNHRFSFNKTKMKNRHKSLFYVLRLLINSKFIFATIFVLSLNSFFPLKCFSQPEIIPLNFRQEITEIKLIQPTLSYLSDSQYENFSPEIFKWRVRTNNSNLEEDSKFVLSDPSNTRLFLSPTARPLKAGDVYFADYMIFFPFIGVGITDFLSIGVGRSIFPGENDQTWYLTSKVTPITIDKVSVACGLLLFNFTQQFLDALALGTFYGGVTYGNQKASLTAGLSWGFAGRDISKNPMIIMVGGDLRISNKIKIITENWFFTEAGISPLLSIGIRIFGENLAGDLGLIYPTGLDSDGLKFLPWLSVTYKF